MRIVRPFTHLAVACFFIFASFGCCCSPYYRSSPYYCTPSYQQQCYPVSPQACATASNDRLVPTPMPVVR
jgi:hypothetical protein